MEVIVERPAVVTELVLFCVRCVWFLKFAVLILVFPCRIRFEHYSCKYSLNVIRYPRTDCVQMHQ
jgi:hypothetical protein